MLHEKLGVYAGQWTPEMDRCWIRKEDGVCVSSRLIRTDFGLIEHVTLTRSVSEAVKGNYGSRLIDSLDHIILVEVPKQIRSQRVRDRSYQKFGDRIRPGGDLYDQESRWFSLTDSRPDTYVTDWLETVDCPVIRIDGTLPVEQNVDDLVSVLSEEND